MVRNALWRRAALVTLIPLLWIGTGCGVNDDPPYSCSWHGTPAGVTVEGLAGTYTGTDVEGEAISLTLSADGRYTSTNLRMVDWLTGDRMLSEDDGSWRLLFDERWDIPLRDEGPPAAKIKFGAGELRIGGAAEHPVLFDPDERGDSCESLPNVLRRS
ncbi:hypothetical protein [Micromonospora sp. NBC_01813]|uniref:hypothetical protein n=1 Tax=Micromonospora sp. NBC_01813 TaxID=2975988 RepID=UPI002DDC58F8|nr:hypothetical protein [Micromonospora sp. NBC_01813]WSA11165.1 hypothetical protein OG958_10540 [Micromonospora sp. NBC_01813]